MTAPMASLSAGLVGRRRPQRAKVVNFMAPKPAAKPAPTPRPLFTANAPKASSAPITASGANAPSSARAAKTVRLVEPLNQALVARAEAEKTSQQKVMEQAIRGYLKTSASL